MNIANWKDLPDTVINEYATRKVFTGEKGTLVRHVIHPGFPPFPHKHPHEQIMVMLEGECDFTVGTEIRRMGPGDVVHVPSDAMHDLQVVGGKPVVNIDVFIPVREDYIVKK